MGLNLEQALKYMPVLYERRINERVVVKLCQIRENRNFVHVAQFLNLVIIDETEHRWVSLRLSTVRGIVKFLTKHSFMAARRLCEQEINILNRKWEKMQKDESL